jgi:hypothetical protein
VSSKFIEKMAIGLNGLNVGSAELGIRYFFPYSLIRYFKAVFRYRYSTTFLNFAIRYRYSLFATSFDQCD